MLGSEGGVVGLTPNDIKIERLQQNNTQLLLPDSNKHTFVLKTELLSRLKWTWVNKEDIENQSLSLAACSEYSELLAERLSYHELFAFIDFLINSFRAWTILKLS